MVSMVDQPKFQYKCILGDKEIITRIKQTFPLRRRSNGEEGRRSNYHFPFQGYWEHLKYSKLGVCLKGREGGRE